MIKKAVKIYKDILDNKINNTLLVIIISFIIVIIGLFVGKS